MIKYSIFDPAGNITALVETNVEIRRQPEVADEIMKVHPEVEQVGFVYFDPIRPVPTYLRMAGGEFCGNATLSAAALYLLRYKEETDKVRVRVTGVSRSLEVRLRKREVDENCYDASVEMPKALGIETEKLSWEGNSDKLSAVMMEGITHVIIERESPLYSLKEDKEAAAAAIRNWCMKLGAECLGFMFLDITADSMKLFPLVYVPGADTVFWENSCASGSAAVGMYLANETENAVDITMEEPGGRLRVTSDPKSGETRLFGSTKLIITENLPE